MTALSLNGRKQWVDFRGVPVAGWDAFYGALAHAGIEGAIRYIDGGSEAKQITGAERLAAVKHGRKILLVDETGTGDAWDAANDFAAGQARGRGALADAKIQGFGQVGIAAAADAHADARQVADATQYAKGFGSIVGKTWAGFYGFMEVLRAVRAAAVVSWYWLCGSMPSAEDARWIAFWQDNRPGARVVIGGVECDINWRLDGPLPGQQEDELSDTAEKQIYSTYAGLFIGSHGGEGAGAWTAPPIAPTLAKIAAAVPALQAGLNKLVDAYAALAAQQANDLTVDQLHAETARLSAELKQAVADGMKDGVTVTVDVPGFHPPGADDQPADTSQEGATA